MKRILLALLIVLVLAVPCAFASGLEVEWRAIPYQIQKFMDLDSESAASSFQGFGSQTGFKYVSDSGFDAGLELEIGAFSYSIVENTTVVDVALRGKVGVATPIDSRVGFELNFAGGIDYKTSADAYVFCPTGKVSLGLRLKCSDLNDCIALNLGASFKIEWKPDVWVDYSFAPYFGVDYKI